MTARGAASKTQLQVWGALIGKQDGSYPQQAGNDWLFFCPCHPDGTKAKRRSLSVGFQDDGSTKAFCYACGGGKPFYDELSQTLNVPRDSFDGERLSIQVKEKSQPQTPVQPQGKDNSVWTYQDADGKPHYRVRRYDRDGGKIFGQDFWDGSKWVKIKDWSGERPVLTLYQLPSLLAAIREGKTVYVVEGEKCADALIARGLPATTNPMGANKWQDHYSELLKGAAVVVLPDNDDTGRQHAQAVFKSLENVAKSVRVQPLPGLQEKGDVYDWLQQGHTVEELLSLAGVPEQAEPEPKPRWSQIERPSQVAQRPPKPWLLDQLLGVGDFMMIAGQPAAGKSFVALDLSVALCLGVPFAGRFQTSQGPKKVLYCASEDYHDRAMRLAAVAHKYGRKVESLDENFAILEGIPSLFLASGEDSFAEFIQGVQASGFAPDLIIFDTLADALAGANENDASDAATVNGNIKRIRQALGCAVCVVHHTGKNGESERGSSAYRAKVDTLLMITSEGEQAGTLTLSKLKAGRAGYDVSFSLALMPVGSDEPSSLQVFWRGEPGYAEEVSESEEEVLAVLRDAGGPITRTALADALGLKSSAAVGNRVRRLLSSGKVRGYLKEPSKKATKANPFLYVLVAAPEIDAKTGKLKLDFTGVR